MMILQQLIFGKAIEPVDANGTTATAVNFDRATLGGVDEVAVLVHTGNVAANMTELKVQHSEDGSTNWGDITGAAFTAPTAAAGDNTLRVALFDARPLRRYLRVVATAGAGATLISSVFIGARSGQTPNTTAERGVTEALVVV